MSMWLAIAGVLCFVIMKMMGERLSIRSYFIVIFSGCLLFGLGLIVNGIDHILEFTFGYSIFGAILLLSGLFVVGMVVKPLIRAILNKKYTS